MRTINKIVLSSALVALSCGTALADNGFTSHHLVDKKSYKEQVERLPSPEKLKVHEYLSYEQREPCQFYQPIPEGFVIEGCEVVKEAPPAPKVVELPPEPVVEPVRQPVLADYELNFDFDSTALESDARNMVDQIAHEIITYSPGEVTVAGYADKAGSSDYNVKLSEKRADAVSRALSARGVAHRVLDQEAYGEHRPAVETKDGVALRENRRVVVEFLK